MKDNKMFWSRMAKFYNKFTRGNVSYNNAYKILEDHIVSELTGDMIVLELASGPGTLSNRIADSCKHLTVTDFSDQMIKEAEKNVSKKNVTFEIANAINLQFLNNSFNVVIIANALHIMPNPKSAIDEIKRVVTNDGLIICPIFTREKIGLKYKEKLLEILGFKTFSRWTNDSYIRFLKENDLEIIRQNTINGYYFPICYVVCKKIA